MFKKNLDVCPNDLPIEHGVALRVYVPDFDGWFADQMSVLTRHERVFLVRGGTYTKNRGRQAVYVDGIYPGKPKLCICRRTLPLM